MPVAFGGEKKSPSISFFPWSEMNFHEVNEMLTKMSNLNIYDIINKLRVLVKVLSAGSVDLFIQEMMDD